MPVDYFVSKFAESDKLAKKKNNTGTDNGNIYVQY